MEKNDRGLVGVVGVICALCGALFSLDYSLIAESGLTLSSIVLAVYIAAIIGLINSDLAKKMQKTVAGSQKDRTQLGVLTLYFKLASFCAIATIVISSVILLAEKPAPSAAELLHYLWSALSVLGIIAYAENLVFLAMIMRFMLNRQIWDK